MKGRPRVRAWGKYEGEQDYTGLLLPPKYAGKYDVRIRERPGDRAVVQVAVRDRATGAEVTFGDGPAVATLPETIKGAAIAKLWRDGKDLAGYARKSLGRPPGVTDIPNDEPLRKAVAQMDRDGRKVTRATLAAEAEYPEPSLRGYLGVTERTMTQLLADLRRT